MKAAQSVEDGTAGLSRCCCEPGVESAASYGPDGSGQGGPAKLLPAERDPSEESQLWKKSLRTTGIQEFFDH